MSKKNLILIILVLSFLFAGAVLAYSWTDTPGFINDTATQTGVAKFDIPTLVATLINALLGLVGAVFVIMILYSGITWMISAGEEDKIKKAKKTLTSAIIGVVIVAGAYSITAFIASTISSAPQGGSGGNETASSCSQDRQGSCKTTSDCTSSCPDCVKGTANDCNTDEVCCYTDKCSFHNGSCRTTDECNRLQGEKLVTNDCSPEICCYNTTVTTPSEGNCSSCGEGSLNVCEATECSRIGSNCIYYEGHCYSLGNDCSRCGTGAGNICDEIECYTIGCKWDASGSPNCTTK